MGKQHPSYWAKENRACLVCGRIFRPHASNHGKGMGTACSRSCANMARGIKRDYEYISALPESEKGYLAGLIDGEGCIHFDRKGNRVFLKIANTDKKMIDWLRGRLGGGITDRPGSGENAKHVYEWCVSTWAAIEILKKIINYLVCKKERAQIMIDFMAKRMTLTENEKDVIKKQMTVLNHRGV